MNTKEKLCEMTKTLWHYYLLDPTKENYMKIIQTWAEDFSMIGTGKHEIYNSVQEAVDNLTENQKDAAGIRFDLLDEWYEGMIVREDVGIVYGGIWVREHMETEDEALVEMDTRFSVVYARDENGKWKITHIHHSSPYFDQTENEYYPKALSAKVKEALDLVEVFKKRSEMDLMTSVYNHESFQRQVEMRLVKGESLCFYVVDLDDFKGVNDTYGHSTGDTLLKFLARLLQEYFSGNAVVGRLGGDEFAVCGTCPGSREESEELLERMREEFRMGAEAILDGKQASYSIGIAGNGQEFMTYRQLYEHADEALYRAKQQGKDRLSFYR